MGFFPPPAQSSEKMSQTDEIAPPDWGALLFFHSPLSHP
jgi:hypothetical protein